MSSKQIEELAKQFILTYLSYLRQKASMLAKRDWGLFPFYWYKPSKMTIFITMWNDLAISINRPVTGKEDRITTRKTQGRIEETHFPNLDYNTWGLFGLKHENAHHILIQGGTYDIGTHPFIKLRSGVEVRFLRIRVEASVRGYPRERMFLWFLTSPNAHKHLTKDACMHSIDRILSEIGYPVSLGTYDDLEEPIDYILSLLAQVRKD